MSSRCRILIGAAALPLVGALLAASMLLPLHSTSENGMTKAQVIEQCGEPVGRFEFIKENVLYVTPGMGILWENSLAEGTEVEMWTYWSGMRIKILYFVGGSDRVAHVGFARPEESEHPLIRILRSRNGRREK